MIQESSRSAGTDDYVTIQGEAPTIKIISDKRDLRVRQFLPTGANVNFQIAVALACLLDIPGEKGAHKHFFDRDARPRTNFNYPKK